MLDQAGQPRAGLEPAQRRLARVLCVDDEPCTLSTLRRVLRSRFDIVSHRDPLAALARVRQGSAFAVVVADMNMPGMTGLQLLAAIHATCPTTVGILWTGDASTVHSAATAEGVFRALGKQCQLEVLQQTIADAAEQHARLLAGSAIR